MFSQDTELRAIINNCAGMLLSHYQPNFVLRILFLAVSHNENTANIRRLLRDWSAQPNNENMIKLKEAVDRVEIKISE